MELIGLVLIIIVCGVFVVAHWLGESGNRALETRVQKILFGEMTPKRK